MSVSEKLFKILLSKTEMTAEEINEMTESEGWELVYSIQPRKPKEPKKLYEVCFTGFPPSEKKELTQVAVENDFHIAKSVTKGLTFLCCGSNAGPSKVNKASQQGTKVITKDEFLNLIETGEMPE